MMVETIRKKEKEIRKRVCENDDIKKSMKNLTLFLKTFKRVLGCV